MRVRIEYEEHGRRVSEIDFDGTLDELRDRWNQRSYDDLLDEIEAESVEVDGGIDWDSAEFKVVDDDARV